MQLLWRWIWYLLPANPMVVRILQGGSVRFRHFLVRIAYLGTLILLLFFGLFTGGSMAQEATLTDLAKAGSEIFYVVAYGQVILICLLAPLFMAGAIASEQAGETFDILLTTPMSNLQIVLGSLLGRLFFVWTLLASGLPLFAVLLILGGIPIQSVFASFAVAACSALMMGAVAVALSVLRAGGRKAVFLFVISVAAYLVAGYVLDRLLLRRVFPVMGVAGVTTWLTPLHPILVLESFINRANYRPPSPEEAAHLPQVVQFYVRRPLGTFALFTSVVSAVLVVWSAVRLRSLEASPARLRSWLRRLLGLATRVDGERRRAPRAVTGNPIAWREANTRGRVLAGVLAQWSYAVLSLGAAVVLVVLYHRGAFAGMAARLGMGATPDDVFRRALLVLLLLELAVVALVAVYMSAGCVSREREDGTLDLMLTTPITPKQYIWGKLRGLVRFLSLLLAVPVLTLAVVAIYTQIGLWSRWPQAEVTYNFGQVRAKAPLMLLEAPLLLLLMLVPYVALCVTVGMNWSLKSRGVLGAVIPAVAILGGLALVLGFCGWTAAENIPFIGPVINGFSPTTNLLMVLNPWETVASFLDAPGAGRVSLFFAALCVAGGYGAIVYGWLTAMVSSFDQTVRRLSGAG